MVEQKTRTADEWREIADKLALLLNEQVQMVDGLQTVLTATADRLPQEVLRMWRGWIKEHAALKERVLETVLPIAIERAQADRARTWRPPAN